MKTLVLLLLVVERLECRALLIVAHGASGLADLRQADGVQLLDFVFPLGLLDLIEDLNVCASGSVAAFASDALELLGLLDRLLVGRIGDGIAAGMAIAGGVACRQDSSLE